MRPAPRAPFPLTLAAALLAIVGLVPGSAPARADTGPHPGTSVEFEGFDGLDYWATLLSEAEGSGPARNADDPLSNEICPADPTCPAEQFLAHEDPDGFHLLDMGLKHASANGGYAWTYYPPSVFKVLVYFPATGEFLSSEILHVAAFDTFVAFHRDGTASASGADPHPDYAAVAQGYAARLAVTLVLEIGVALLFGLRRWRALLVIAAANVITQALLTLTLALWGVGGMVHGRVGSGIALLVAELVVFAIEAVAYALVFPPLGARASRRPVGAAKAVVYAAVANAASFLLGGTLGWFVYSFTSLPAYF
jgi:hypothetical protein